MTEPDPGAFQPGGWPSPDPRRPGVSGPATGGEQGEAFQAATWDRAGFPGPSPVPAGAAPPLPYGPWHPPPLPGPMPTQPVSYPQLLRGPRRRWWRPLFALVVAVAIAVYAQVLAIFPVVLAGAVAGVQGLGSWLLRQTDALAAGRITPAGFLYVNLGLIALIPAAGLSTWAAHQVRPRFVSSVAGGIRWRWLFRCILVIVPLWAIYTGIGFLGEVPKSARPVHWVLLLVMVVVLTPLQAAGEEYLFRGWILQNIGSWFARPVLGLLAGTVVSAVVFAAAHGSPDPWILGSIGSLAVAACIAAWRTGGLEAGIVMHAVNNLAAFGVVLTNGGWNQAFITGGSTGSAGSFLLDLGVNAAALALIWWQARRSGLRWHYEPHARPEPIHPGYPLPPAGSPDA